MKKVEASDLHIHTTYSDGELTPLSVVKAAIKKNLSQICITDHYSHFKPAIKTIEELERYFHEVTKLKNKYSTQIRVAVGIEVDMISTTSFDDLKTIPWDFILFEYVFASQDWEQFFKNVIKFKQSYKIGAKIGLAHTRFTRVTHSKFDSVLRSIRENKIVIELNSSYQNYLDPWFNYLDGDYLYSIGSDAHSLEDIGNVSGAISFLCNRNIPVNRIIRL